MVAPPLPAPHAFPAEPRRALWVSCWIGALVPHVHTAQMETLYILQSLPGASQTVSGTLQGGAIILKAFISEAVGPFFLDDHEVSPYIQPSKGELPVLLAGVEGLALPLALTPRWPRKPLDRIQGTASTVGR